MPLYNYKCNDCEYIVEKFQSGWEAIELECESCGGECGKVFGRTHTRTSYNARDTLERRITPEVDRISDQISKGNEKDFFDIHGEE